MPGSPSITGTVHLLLRGRKILFCSQAPFSLLTWGPQKFTEPANKALSSPAAFSPKQIPLSSSPQSQARPAKPGEALHTDWTHTVHVLMGLEHSQGAPTYDLPGRGQGVSHGKAAGCLQVSCRASLRPPSGTLPGVTPSFMS